MEKITIGTETIDLNGLEWYAPPRPQERGINVSYATHGSFAIRRRILNDGATYSVAARPERSAVFEPDLVAKMLPDSVWSAEVTPLRETPSGSPDSQGYPAGSLIEIPDGEGGTFQLRSAGSCWRVVT